MNAEQERRLQAYLSRLDPTSAAKFAFALETDKLAGGGLPHDLILGILRPALRDAVIRHERLPTPQRMFCQPFEDLLTSMPRRAKQTGRISRSSIAPVWAWLHRALGDEARAVVDAVGEALVKGGRARAQEPAEAMQRRFGKALLELIPAPDPSSAAFKAAAQELGGADVAGDAYDMARLLEAAPDVHDLRLRLPKPIESLDADLIEALKEWYRPLEPRYPFIAPYLAFLILGRLERPWEILRLTGALSRKMDDLMISRTDAGLVGELLLSDIEECADLLSRMRPQELDAEAATACVGAFARLATGIVRELGIKRDGAWGKRLMQARVVVAESMDRLLARAEKDVAATLPMQRGGFGLSRRKKPDLLKAVDPMKAAKALAYARLIAGCRRHGTAAAFASLLNKVDEAVCLNLRHYLTELIEELADLDPGDETRADAQIAHALSLSATLLGEDETSLIRRRVAAAREAGRAAA